MKFHVLYKVGATKLPIAGAAVWSINEQGDLIDLLCTTGADGVAEYNADSSDELLIRITAYGFSSKDRTTKIVTKPLVLEKINSSAYTGFSPNSSSAYWKQKDGENFFEFFADGTMRSFYGENLIRYSLREKGKYSMRGTRSLAHCVTDEYGPDNHDHLWIFRFPKPAVMFARNDQMTDEDAIEFELFN